MGRGGYFEEKCDWSEGVSVRRDKYWVMDVDVGGIIFYKYYSGVF